MDFLKKLLVRPNGYQQIPKAIMKKKENDEMLTRANIIFFEMPFSSILFYANITTTYQ
jgi:hypothetical protein